MTSPNFNVLKWHAHSLHVSPIEHLWAGLICRLNQYQSPPTKKLELWERLKECQASITPWECRRACQSESKSVQLIKAFGQSSKLLSDRGCKSELRAIVSVKYKFNVHINVKNIFLPIRMQHAQTNFQHNVGFVMPVVMACCQFFYITD